MQQFYFQYTISSTSYNNFIDQFLSTNTHISQFTFITYHHHSSQFTFITYYYHHSFAINYYQHPCTLHQILFNTVFSHVSWVFLFRSDCYMFLTWILILLDYIFTFLRLFFTILIIFLAAIPYY